MKLIDKLILPVALALIVSVAGIVARVAVATNASAQPEGIELPIVMYHHILKDQSRLNKYTISPDEFRRDMQYLQDNGYTPVLMQDLLLFVQEGVPLPDGMLPTRESTWDRRSSMVVAKCWVTFSPMPLM